MLLNCFPIPDWPYRSKFNEAIIDFQESGVLTKMKNKWWNEVGTSGCSVRLSHSDAATLFRFKAYYICRVKATIQVWRSFELITWAACSLCYWWAVLWQRSTEYWNGFIIFLEKLVDVM